MKLDTARQRALTDWRDIIGAQHVLTDEALLTAAETATFATDACIPVILRPADTDQVCEVLRVANRYEFAVYPVSSGKNWGYGSRVPTSDLCALIDLSRMNRILDFSGDLAYVTVQPGVTQRQLFQFLEGRGSRLWMDASGSSPECSLIGNAMERGFGHTPYGDHFAHVCGLEVVLASGEIIETGFSGYPGSQTGPIYRWGVGPSVDGLFSQSNLGIVTRMTIWLMPAPEHFEAFFFRCGDEHSLSALVNALRPLRLDGTLRSSVHIANDYKVLSGIQQYPWGYTQGRTPLSLDDMVHFRETAGCGSWNGSGGLYGTPRQVREARRLLKRALRGKVSRLQFLDERKLHLAARFSRLYHWVTGWDLSRALELARPIFGLMKGIPTGKTMGSVYWRKRTPVPDRPDPDRDGCGLLWCAPIAPLDGNHAERVTALIYSIVLKHGFEPMVSLTLVNERAMACVGSITYDREVPGEDERAMECHRELLELLIASGYPSYRLGIQSMDTAQLPVGLVRLLSRIRHALDPAGILAPGRYESRRKSLAQVKF